MSTRIRVSYGRTIQPRSYEAIRMDVAIEKDVPDGESVIDAANKSVESLRKYVKAKLTESILFEGYK